MFDVSQNPERGDATQIHVHAYSCGVFGDEEAQSRDKKPHYNKNEIYHQQIINAEGKLVALFSEDIESFIRVYQRSSENAKARIKEFLSPGTARDEILIDADFYDQKLMCLEPSPASRGFLRELTSFARIRQGFFVRFRNELNRGEPIADEFERRYQQWRQAINQIVEANRDAAFYILRRRQGSMITSSDDREDIVNTALMEAAVTWDPARGQFTSVLSIQLLNVIGQITQCRSRDAKNHEYDEQNSSYDGSTVNQLPSSVSSFDESWEGRRIEAVLECMHVLTDFEQEVVQEILRSGSGKNLKRRRGASDSEISVARSSAIEKLRRELGGVEVL